MNIEFVKEDLQKIADECFSKTDLALKLGFKFFNGKISKKIMSIIKQYDISIDHFDPTKKNKDRRKYPIVIKQCPVCDKEFETLGNHPKETKTCSYSCSNTYFSSIRYTNETSIKKSKSLNLFHESNGTQKTRFERQCLFCNNIFETFKKYKKFCTQSCSTKYNWQQPKYRYKMLSNINQRILNGTHKGWASRQKIKPSFPEKVTMEILNELNISYNKDYKCGKWFIDFADVPNKIALEIDGKQHELPERKVSDQQKDNFLTSEGWKVFRIKWQKLTPEIRQELKIKINEIFKIRG